MKKLVKAVTMAVILGIGVSGAWALTPEQVIQLKKAGVSDETIRLMLEQERADRERNAADQMGTREVKDAQGNTSINYSTGAPPPRTSEQHDVEKAWKMLQNQNVIIDKRR